MAVNPSKYQIYAEKDLNRAQIDWGTVGKTLSDGLLDIANEREAKKQKIADDTVDAMNKLSEVPDVNNQTLSAMIINGSEQSKRELQARMDLVKRGISKPKDYKLFMNAQQNGYKSVSNIVKNYDKYYTSKMEAIEANTQSELDEAVAKSVEQFGNINNKVLWTNPVNGQLQLVTMGQDADGNYTVMPDPNKNPEKFQNPNSINTIMRFNEKRKDVNVDAKKVTDKIGAYIYSYVNDEYGNVVTVEDFSKRKIGGKSFDSWMDSQINYLTATDNDTTQILTNSGEFSITFSKDEADKDPSKIFVDNSSGSPKITITENQEKRARELAREAIDAQIDKKITQTQPPSDARQRKVEDTESASYIKELNTIMTGNQTDSEAAVKRLIDTANQSVKFQDDKIVSFDITEDEIIIKRANGDPFIIDRKKDTGIPNNPETPEDESVDVLTTLDEVVSINNILSPTNLSKAKIEDLISKENIKLGPRRKDEISTRTPKSEIETFSSTTLNPISESSLLSDLQGPLGKDTDFDTNERIKNEVSAGIAKHMPKEMQDEIATNPNLYGPTTVEKDGTKKIIITIAGIKTVIDTTGGKPISELANEVAQAINKARVKVNENRMNPNKKEDEEDEQTEPVDYSQK